MVERVEPIEVHRQVVAPGVVERLAQRHVEIDVARAGNQADRRIADLPRRGCIQVRYIPPGSARRTTASLCGYKPTAGCCTPPVPPRPVCPCLRRKPRAALVARNSRQLPASDTVADQEVVTRKRVCRRNVADRNDVPPIERRIAIVVSLGVREDMRHIPVVA